MYTCDICGRKSNKKISYAGHILCSKHMHQYHNFGKFLDSNPRTTADPNEIHIYNDTASIDIYDQKSNKIGSFIIDLEDLDKVRNFRWRQSYGRIVTGNNTKSRPTKYLTHLLLDIDKTGYNFVIDHIDGNPYNNKKENLRVCSQGENTCNKSHMTLNTSGIIGVSLNKRSRYASEIRYQNHRYHLGEYHSLEEAAYSRYIAETYLFKEFRNTNNDDIKMQLFAKISDVRKNEISTYVYTKLPK